MIEILKQEYLITSPFNKEMLLESLRSQLDSLILKELINNDGAALTVTFIISLDDSK